MERRPRGQTLVKEPNEDERSKRELTHTPYQPWCDACVRHRAKPDRRLRTGASQESAVPIVSMDFAVTKKKEGLDPKPEGEVADKGALWLALNCSQTGYLSAIPIQAKSQLHYMTHDVLTFVQTLGCAKIGFYGDNGPTINRSLRRCNHGPPCAWTQDSSSQRLT